MKSRLLSIIHFVTNAVRPIPLSLFLALVSSSVLHAQDTWQVDPQYSIAHLSLGSEPNVLEIGLARISGNVVFKSNNPADPSISLKIDAGNDTGADYSKISFTSDQSWVTSDGKLMVLGQLSVTRIERSVTMDANEAYSGPQYGEPVAHSYDSQITLCFGPGQVTADNGLMAFNGRTSINREDFPQLLAALTLDPWPNVLVNDDRCEEVSTIGEDYYGPECTGAVIASVHNEVVPTAVPGGEGFYGFEPVVTPDRNRATIVLDLKLQKAAASSVSSR